MKGKRIWVSLVFVAIAIGAIVYGLHIMNAPSVGTVRTGSVEPVAAVEDKAVSDEFVSFSYNGLLTERPSDPVEGTTVSRYWFTRGDMSGWELSVQVMEMNGRRLQDDGSYNLRATRSDMYTKSMFETSKGMDVTVFADVTGSYNKTAFISNGTYYATISLKGGGQPNDPKLVKTMSGILSSWQWRS